MLRMIRYAGRRDGMAGSVCSLLPSRQAHNNDKALYSSLAFAYCESCRIVSNYSILSYHLYIIIVTLTKPTYNLIQLATCSKLLFMLHHLEIINVAGGKRRGT
jgi:hypothetical protein